MSAINLTEALEIFQASIRATTKGGKTMSEQVEILTLHGIDDWHRPIFIDQHKNYYGSTDKLFYPGTPNAEVLAQVTESDITFFGRRFNCEPMGTPVDNVKIERVSK